MRIETLLEFRNQTFEGSFTEWLTKHHSKAIHFIDKLLTNGVSLDQININDWSCNTNPSVYVGIRQYSRLAQNDYKLALKYLGIGIKSSTKSIEFGTDKRIAEQATGCRGAGNYKDYAEKHGYKFLEVLDWTSSAGDWSFIVSKDKKHWRILYQENKYPHSGFRYSLSKEEYVGTAKQVLTGLYAMC